MVLVVRVKERHRRHSVTGHDLQAVHSNETLYIYVIADKIAPPSHVTAESFSITQFGELLSNIQLMITSIPVQIRL